MSPEYFFTSSAMAWWYGDRAVSSERASFIRAGEALAPPPPPPPRGLFEPGPPPSSRTESRRCIFPSDVDLSSRPEGDARPGAPGGGGGGGVRAAVARCTPLGAAGGVAEAEVRLQTPELPAAAADRLRRRAIAL